MTEETILTTMERKIKKDLLPILGNGLSLNDFVKEILELTRDAMRKARREALRGN